MAGGRNMRHSHSSGVIGVFICILVIVAFCGSPCEAGSNSSRAQEPDLLYDQAMSILKESLDDKSLTEALALLEGAAELDPENEEVWIQISWRYWMRGDALPKESRQERQKRLELFGKGMAAGEKALAINPKSIGGMYWYTVNMASEGEMRGILSSLWMAGTLFGNMSRVDRRDPYYLYGATRRFGSEVFVRVPTWLTERFGFKTEYIEEDLLDNIKRWPNYFDNYTFLARVYWWEGSKDKALDMLEYVLTHSPVAMPEEKAENARQQVFAREMWKEYTGKEFPQR
jgi:tetratricopeptide (TPR) repeat protein